MPPAARCATLRAFGKASCGNKLPDKKLLSYVPLAATVPVEAYKKSLFGKVWKTLLGTKRLSSRRQPSFSFLYQDP